MAALVYGYQGVVCDLDGVVYRGPHAVDHAVEVLTSLAVPVIYATNNASRTPDQVAAHLRSLGLDVTAADVATSAEAGAAELAQRLGADSPVLAVGGDGVRDALRRSGLDVVTPAERRNDPSLAVVGVLQGYGPEVTAADLAEAAYAIAGGALWVATNTDATLPTERGTAPGNGSLVAAVRRAVDLDPVVVGKPMAPLYAMCAERLGLPARSVLAVGDRIDTDIAGAVSAGMDSVLVLTGVDSVSTAALAPHDQRPTHVVEDLRSLRLDYLPPRKDGDWWACGGDRRRVAGAGWRVESAGAPIEAARAGLACLHEALDRGDLDADAVRALAAELDVWQ